MEGKKRRAGGMKRKNRERVGRGKESKKTNTASKRKVKGIERKRRGDQIIENER